jgi:hypothetical protein
MRLAASVLLLVGTTACSQQVYSPPAQTYALGPIRSLDDGRRALDLEASTHAQMWDPSIHAFDGRYRTGIGDNTELSVEGTAHAVAERGPSMANRTFYSGRAGIRTNPRKSGVSFFAGAGGGYAAAGGSFAAVDSGLSVGYDNCILVPVFQVSGFASQPLAPRPVDVTDDEYYTTDTPKFTLGSEMRGGLRLSLSPSACRAGEQVPWITLGAGVTTLADADSHAALMGAGLGFEIPL